MKEKISNMLDEAVELNKKISESQIGKIKKIVGHIVETIKRNNKIILCGNGGSATQASHIAAEFVGRYKKERKAWPAISLNTDIANLTAIANDYGYDKIFERQVEALGNKGDVLIGISTSGDSENIIKAFDKARDIGIITIGFLGKNGGLMKEKSDIEIIIPSENTPRIQEAHITILHIICELVEEELTR